MSGDGVTRQLLGAELWERGGASASARLLAGWEDGTTYCAAVCSTDLGLAFCRACPEAVATRALRDRRARSDRCPAGVRLLAFPAPAGSDQHVAILRVAPPPIGSAPSIAERVRVAPRVLRRAARDTPAADGRASLGAARVLRDPAGVRDWQIEQRARGADRRRSAAQALAQVIATSDELHELVRASRRQRSQLDRSRRLLDRLARQALRAKDEERSRIAHEIHDTAAQSMVSAFRFVDAARAASGANGKPPDPRLVHASERLATAIAEVRAVLARLLPPGLEELGLADALRTRLTVAAADANRPLIGRVSGELPRLEAWVEQALYGMASEAISNALRHGDAGTIEIDLRIARGRAVVTVADDGRGFEPVATVRTEGGGIGLVGMARQASWMGGSARIASRPGSGTRIRISIPLERHLRARSSDGSGSRDAGRDAGPAAGSRR